MQIKEPHVPVLDAIRGLAIALVLFIHIGISLATSENGFARFVYDLSSSCWIGVDLFFVLSGFLITGILFDTRDATNYFKAFYARRFLRIFPIYYGFLCLLLILTVPLQIHWNGRQFVYLLYLQNTRIQKDIFSAPFSPYLNVGHFWSLAVEEQFYCLWPALVFLVRNRAKLIQLALVVLGGSLLIRIAMVHVHVSYWMIYIFTPARADSLMMGAILALLFRCDDTLRQWLKPAATILLPISLAILVMLSIPTHGLDFSTSAVAIGGYSIVALASASVITLSLTSATFSHAVNWPILRWLGKYSYGIYVLDLPIMDLLLHLKKVSAFTASHNDITLTFLVTLAAAIPGILAAYLSYNLYEARFMRLKARFPYNIAQPADQLENAGHSYSVS